MPDIQDHSRAAKAFVHYSSWFCRGLDQLLTAARNQRVRQLRKIQQLRKQNEVAAAHHHSWQMKQRQEAERLQKIEDERQHMVQERLAKEDSLQVTSHWVLPPAGPADLGALLHAVAEDVNAAQAQGLLKPGQPTMWIGQVTAVQEQEAFRLALRFPTTDDRSHHGCLLQRPLGLHRGTRSAQAADHLAVLHVLH